MLVLEFLFLLYKVFVQNFNAFVLTKLLNKSLLELRAHSLLLKLMEAVHDNVLGVNVFNSHHV